MIVLYYVTFMRCNKFMVKIWFLNGRYWGCGYQQTGRQAEVTGQLEEIDFQIDGVSTLPLTDRNLPGKTIRLLRKRGSVGPMYSTRILLSLHKGWEKHFSTVGPLYSTWLLLDLHQDLTC
eukprot:sb/3476210/